MKLSNQPPKGTSDWLPEEFAVRKYIFDTWRQVCLKFGYKEYLTPLVESAEVYRAKSGEDVGGRELTTFFDRGERELAIRPEMTPSVTRMVSQFYESSPKPIRLFSIANFFRNEKPQKGRNREFWQLNADIFGSDSVNADVEILSLAIEIMKSFGSTKDQFIVYINDRNLISSIIVNFLGTSLENVGIATRILDKFGKISSEELMQRLKSEAGCKLEDTQYFTPFFEGDDEAIQYVIEKYLKNDTGYTNLKKVIQSIESLGYGEFIKYNPSMVRGFDYYDGMVFEVYDRRDYLQKSGALNENNSYRSLFGGGRYNGLAGLFGSQSFPAVGFAPGDETTRLFLSEWNLIPKNLTPETYYLPILSANLSADVMQLALKLRLESKNVIAGLEVQKFGKALEYADKIKATYTVILGEDEKSRGEYQIKNMKTGEQKIYNLS